MRGFDAQLASTRLFVTPQEIAAALDHARTFLFDKAIRARPPRAPTRWESDWRTNTFWATSRTSSFAPSL